MLHEYSRMELLVGEKMVEELGKARVAVFGIGGVGSYAAEALARCGIGALTLVDYDTVSITHINRQLTALHSTVGRPKTQVMKERIRDIDPNILVSTYETFFNRETGQLFDFHAYDYIVDAMDTVESKLLLIEKAREAKTDIISCMGLGDKLNPSRLEIADINKVTVCPMAKIMKAELRKKKIKQVKVLYSREFPVMSSLIEKRNSTEKNEISKTDKEIMESRKRPIPGSVSFVPGAAGMLIAGEVVRDLIKSRR